MQSERIAKMEEAVEKTILYAASCVGTDMNRTTIYSKAAKNLAEALYALKYSMIAGLEVGTVVLADTETIQPAQ